MMQLHRVTHPDRVHAALESRRPHPASHRLVPVERSTRPGDERALSGLKSAAFGAVSGCLATIPMTATMAAGYSALPQNEHDSLPPRQITMKLAQAVGIVHKMDELERVEATAAAHFAYATLMGGVFGARARGRVRPDVETGIAFELAVWAGSYLGLPMLPSTMSRVPSQTADEINQQIYLKTIQNVAQHSQSGAAAIERRLQELDQEWDIERVLETNAASVSLVGLALGATVDRRWFLLPVAVAAFLLQHALQGWCPPLPFFRRMGIRTASEIYAERYALKALRGDFQIFDPESGDHRTKVIQRAVDATRV